MGIYVFTWAKIKEYLIKDNDNPHSSNDFGKNIIPEMLNANEKMMAYLFEGYWKDVGTIESLWEANMDLLSDHPQLNLQDDNWRIYGRNMSNPPHYIGTEAHLKNSIVGDGCIVMGEVENSILFPSVVIEKGAIIKDSIIMQDTVIKSGSKIYKTIIDESVTVEENTTVGGNDKITVIGTELTIKAGSTIAEGAMLDPAD